MSPGALSPPASRRLLGGAGRGGVYPSRKRAPLAAERRRGRRRTLRRAAFGGRGRGEGRNRGGAAADLVYPLLDVSAQTRNALPAPGSGPSPTSPAPATCPSLSGNLRLHPRSAVGSLSVEPGSRERGRSRASRLCRVAFGILRWQPVLGSVQGHLLGAELPLPKVTFGASEEAARPTSRSRGNQSALPTRHFTRTREMEAGPRTSASEQAAPTNGRGPDSEGRQGKKRKKYKWTVTEVGDTRIKMKRTRVGGFRSKDLAVFYELLHDPVIENFLNTDVRYYANDENLLALIAKYFGRLEFIKESFSMIHVFLALYAVSQMDTLDLSYEWLIFPALFESNWYEESLKKFWPLQIEFLNSIDWKAWVSQEIDEEINGEGSMPSILWRHK
ncbi:uncharacterized protein LOC110203443 [Phascolarctos cinereus]|uniref:Uncharacterized protein LOC110203443 n=1 Tax=Phascolarctos cinereus TaxID=38626 RepID=A0A6P5JN52_PHACI|nr:uncharacterized protein LOC110203443 [Phascolarctos cinereus]